MNCVARDISGREEQWAVVVDEYLLPIRFATREEAIAHMAQMGSALLSRQRREWRATKGERRLT